MQCCTCTALQQLKQLKVGCSCSFKTQTVTGGGGGKTVVVVEEVKDKTGEILKLEGTD